MYDRGLNSRLVKIVGMKEVIHVTKGRVAEQANLVVGKVIHTELEGRRTV